MGVWNEQKVNDYHVIFLILKRYLSELLKYWKNSFNWRNIESKLNQFNHFIAKIDDIDLHFIHERSINENAIPILLIHGWPSTFYEFQKVIPLLVNAEDFGGTVNQSFHVIVPSLPGYGFSSYPKDAAVNVTRIADIFIKLMSKLGYKEYIVQGGDWVLYLRKKLILKGWCNSSRNCQKRSSLQGSSFKLLPCLSI